MTARSVILPPPPDAAPASLQCMPPPAPCDDEPADSTRLTVPGGYTPDLDVDVHMGEGAWYEREEP